jgi:hypothetical protein
MKTLYMSILVCLGAASALQADPMIKFDDLPSEFVPVPSGYHGLNWSNLFNLDAVNYSSNPSGYQAGVVSTNFVVYGGAGSTSVISAEMFDLISAYLTAAWNDNLQFEAKGYIKGTLVYDQTTILSATSPTLVNFNFYGVDEVDFTSSGGTPHAGYNGAGAYFALDNLSVVTYVPFTAPLLANGGFETGDFTGWSDSGNTNNTSVVTTASYVHSGVYGAQIGPVTTPGFLSQVLPTQIGEVYSVSCWLENFGVGPNNFTLSWAGFPVFGLTNQPAFGWTNIQFNLVASRPKEFLEFEFLNNPSFFGFDDVSVAPALLVSNGGFETGDFSGWTPSGNSSKDLVTTSATARRVGSFGADFAASGSLGFISQTVATQPGQPYLVSCWLNSPDGMTPNHFKAMWNGQTLLEEAGLSGFGWTNLHFTVNSPNTQTVLEFGLRDDPSSLGLDEVSVLPVPILQNGGFEFGDFTGWTTSGNFTFSSVSTNALYADSGFYGGQFGPVTTLGYLSQTVTTVPGQTYLIGFMLDNPRFMTNAEFNVAWNGTPLMDVTNLGLIGWLPYEFLVTASGTTSTLKFGFRDDPSYLGLDEVFISAIPVPVFQSIVTTKKEVDLTWSALPDYLYELQSNTNLMGTNWITVQNLSFPATIPMKGTDTNPPIAERFYRVLMAPPPLIF